MYYYCMGPCYRSLVEHCHLLATVPTCKRVGSLAAFSANIMRPAEHSHKCNYSHLSPKTWALISFYSSLLSSGFRLSSRSLLLSINIDVGRPAAQFHLIPMVLNWVVPHQTGKIMFIMDLALCMEAMSRQNCSCKVGKTLLLEVLLYLVTDFA